MKKYQSPSLLLTCLLFLLPVKNMAHDNTFAERGRSYVPGSVIVKFKSSQNNTNINPRALDAGAASVNDIMSKYGVLEMKKLFPTKEAPLQRGKVDLSTLFELTIPDDVEPLQMIGELEENETIEYAQPNYILRTQAVPDDPQYSQQEHLPQIAADRAWDITHGSKNVIIAITDTGVDWDHPDLADNIWTNPSEVVDGLDNDGNGYVDDIRGWDWVNVPSNYPSDLQPATGEDGTAADNNPMDFNGHGTFVSGLASAVTNNGTGVAGVGWSCSIMALRIGYSTKKNEGVADDSWIVKAMEYAVDNGADIINFSWGAPFDDLVVTDILRFAFENNVLVCVAAGNDNKDYGYMPATVSWTLGVTAVDDRDMKPSYANYGDWVDVSAPGGNVSGGRQGILSTTFNDSYTRKQGTSASSPIVAGVAGLVRAVHPDWSAAQVLMHIVDTADNVDAVNPAYAGQLGKKGRVNAYRAVSEPFHSTPEISLIEMVVDDSPDGNFNGKAEPGETVSLVYTFQNKWADASGVQVVLESDDPCIQVINNSAQIPVIYGLSSVDSNYADNSHQPFVVQVSEQAYPHSALMALRLTDNSGFSQTLPVHLAIQPNILLIDNDGGRENERFYLAALDSLGLGYTYWNYEKQGSPYKPILAHNTVIWFNEWSLPTLNNSDRSLLSTYLDQGVNLFLSGQRIGYDLCEANAPQRNEYRNSLGRSRQFHEDYLHAEYLTYQTTHRDVRGVADDPVSAGLNFSIWQPDRGLNGSDETLGQNPCEINPLDGAVSIFDYPNGKSGAIRYSDGYKLVYFAFGGFESIEGEQARRTVMDRVVKYFDGIHVELETLSDSEDTTQAVNVVARVKSARPLDKVQLFWRSSPTALYSVVDMDSSGENSYSAFIPAQGLGTTVEYFVLAFDDKGAYNAAAVQQFKVASDRTAPAIAEIEPIPNQLRNKGPFDLRLQASDNSGVDTTNAQLIYWREGEAQDSVRLFPGENDSFTGSINGSFPFGDTVFYQVRLQDLSVRKNTGLSTVYHFVIGFEDFENGLSNWTTGEGEWGLDSFRPYSGNFSLHESPSDGNLYGNNEDISIALKYPLDLSSLASAILSFWDFYAFAENDFGLVEASRDGGKTWLKISGQFTGVEGGYREELVSLADFTGPGNEDVLIRFRMISDSSGAGPGWFIDDVRIYETPTSVASVLSSGIPAEFVLYNNYPNPFNQSTRIEYALPVNATVELSIYNLLGQKLVTLFSGSQAAGRQSVTWDGRDGFGQSVPSGLYFYRLEAGEFRAVKKLAIVR
jgi:subtilisin family serine protease